MEQMILFQSEVLYVESHYRLHLDSEVEKNLLYKMASVIDGLGTQNMNSLYADSPLIGVFGDSVVESQLHSALLLGLLDLSSLYALTHMFGFCLIVILRCMKDRHGLILPLDSFYA
ncbi:hypothetical protein SLA2020_047000 [Shorea laevis]